eukprot:CAMPEP_0178407180 /NCGR_PEP_ID=MMETSP0689_2-20121128/19294_1 /TAXON_ID=160604 /ORGANISM="Amphidinium massartii, Strain CS-259" /LENGTH=108 /DNA_ID=CAMNT_0020028243 /DNA_START=477 /DNA_END=803 /DNA_ORIENTATION=-
MMFQATAMICTAACTRKRTVQHGVHKDAKCKQVYFLIIRLSSCHLWCNEKQVSESTSKVSLLLGVMSRAEVTHLDATRFCMDPEARRSSIAMYDATGVEVLQPLKHVR